MMKKGSLTARQSLTTKQWLTSQLLTWLLTYEADDENQSLRNRLKRCLDLVGQCPEEPFGCSEHVELWHNLIAPKGN